MLENYPRNPFLILLFTFIGMVIRFMFINLILFVRGIKSRDFWSFSNGFKQVVYNLLLTFFLILAVTLFFIYKSIPIVN